MRTGVSQMAAACGIQRYQLSNSCGAISDSYRDAGRDARPSASSVQVLQGVSNAGVT
ncbi:hypothetical protein [Pseudomonas abietaniphila]|uniref:hypothetical protein n=1 Tax=Pseudomonas abietaniphila TaxID=89065 RepID=UPI0013B034F8|nr:hypothetical protein [Pseudomonas abietaniphila]